MDCEAHNCSTGSTYSCSCIRIISERGNIIPLAIRLCYDTTSYSLSEIFTATKVPSSSTWLVYRPAWLVRSLYSCGYNPGYSFNYQFLDQDYQALYAAEQRVSTLSRYFAGIAILISCLGLFGLAAFTAERRLKEIGIRKILGATDFGIVRLLSSDFTKLVLVAIFIALPISYFVAQRWLQGFAFSIDLEWWYFAGAGGVALLIAWLSVGFQTIKAARVNPVECLKDE